MGSEKSEEQRTIFERLREIRQQKKIELEEISQHTKIHMKYLEAIEQETPNVIPAIYDALFFKSYLSYLDLEKEQENEFLTAFEELRKAKMRAGTQTTIVRRRRIEKTNKRRSGFIQAVYIAAPLLVVTLIIVILAWHSTSGEEELPQTVDELSVEEIVNQMQPTSEEPASDKVQDVEDDSVFVQINALDRTWLRIIRDHRDTTEYLLAAEEKVAIEGDSVLNFVIGNAAGVQLTVNGTDIGYLGESNQVVSSLKITADGVVNKRVKTIKPREVAVDTAVVQ